MLYTLQSCIYFWLRKTSQVKEANALNSKVAGRLFNEIFCLGSSFRYWWTFEILQETWNKFEGKVSVEYWNLWYRFIITAWGSTHNIGSRWFRLIYLCIVIHSLFKVFYHSHWRYLKECHLDCLIKVHI